MSNGHGSIKRAAFALVALATIGAAMPSVMPQRLACVEAGVWGCHPEPEGICIDGHRAKMKRRYSFDFHRMTFKHPGGQGRILSISDPIGNVSKVRLSNDTEFEYDPRHTNRWGHIVVTLTPVPLPTQSYGVPELWCRP